MGAASVFRPIRRRPRDASFRREAAASHRRPSAIEPGTKQRLKPGARRPAIPVHGPVLAVLPRPANSLRGQIAGARERFDGLAEPRREGDDPVRLEPPVLAESMDRRARDAGFVC